MIYVHFGLDTNGYPQLIKKKLLLFHHCAILGQEHIGSRERAKYDTFLQCITAKIRTESGVTKMAGQKRPKYGIINTLFDGLRADILIIARNSHNIRAYYMLNHRIR